MKNYKVLWIDDEFEKQDAFIESAFLSGIEINAVKTSKRGMEMLEDNLFDFDGVILDAKVFDESEDEVAKLTGLSKSINKIKELMNKKIVPYYIFTGQPDLFDNTTFEEMLAGKKVYKKAIDNEVLFGDIKLNADKLYDTNLKHKYHKAFKVFEDNIIEKKYRHNLVEMLSCLENNDYKKKNLNVIRDVLESFYLSLIHRYIYIPESFLTRNNKPNLEWCTIYMEGRETRDASNNKYTIRYSIPKHISSNLRSLKNISSQFSHLNDNDEVKNSFISSAYAMLEVLEWLSEFISENFDY